jgi:hypothetical protein
MSMQPDLDRADLLRETGTAPVVGVPRSTWDQPHTWGLDPGNHVDAALRAHYWSVAVVCGHTVWLHDGVSRHLATTLPASACGPGDQ